MSKVMSKCAQNLLGFGSDPSLQSSGASSRCAEVRWFRCQRRAHSLGQPSTAVVCQVSDKTGASRFVTCELSARYLQALALQANRISRARLDRANRRRSQSKSERDRFPGWSVTLREAWRKSGAHRTQKTFQTGRPQSQPRLAADRIDV